jgi:hypothetical protein
LAPIVVAQQLLLKRLRSVSSVSLHYAEIYEPMPLSFVLLALLDILAFSSLAASGVMVEAEGDLEKVLAKGPRCVSLSSAKK